MRMHLNHLELCLRALRFSSYSSKLYFSDFLLVSRSPTRSDFLRPCDGVFELAVHLQIFLLFFLSFFLLPSSMATSARPLCLIYDRAVVLVVIGSACVLALFLGLWRAEVNSKD